MKFLSLLICSFLIATASLFAQKKTHDHEKFVKKVTMSLAPSLITKWMPDDEAIEYVAERVDESKEELKAELEKLKVKVKEDAQFIIDNGIYANKYNDITVNVKRESPVKTADIILHCEFKGDVFDVTLKNCVQTDQSWYIAGRIIASGEGIKGAMAKQEERRNSSKGGLLGKIEKLEEKAEAEAEVEASSDRMIYEAKRFPMQGTDASSQFVQYDKVGQTLDGYYIDQDYKKVETKIKYEAPEIMSDPNKFIVINGYDIVKSNFKAFCVAGQMYVFTGEYWDILVKEGAIRQLARVVKDDASGNYVLGELVQKLDLGPENTVSFMMGFKNKMADLVSDNEAMAKKVKNKDDGYKFKDIEKIIAEYNAWFDKQYPGKVEYLLERVNNGGAAVEEEMVVEEEMEMEAETEEIVGSEIDEEGGGLHQKLIGSWKYNNAVYKETGEPVIEHHLNHEDKTDMELKPDGSVVLPQAVLDEHNISNVNWRVEKVRGINCLIITMKKGGFSVKKTNPIVSIEDNTLTIGDNMLREFKR